MAWGHPACSAPSAWAGPCRVVGRVACLVVAAGRLGIGKVHRRMAGTPFRTAAAVDLVQSQVGIRDPVLEQVQVLVLRVRVRPAVVPWASDQGGLAVAWAVVSVLQDACLVASYRRGQGQTSQCHRPWRRQEVGRQSVDGMACH